MNRSRIESVQLALSELAERASDEYEADYEKWVSLATGQDSEEAEYSGYLEGRRDGLLEALSLVTPLLPTPLTPGQKHLLGFSPASIEAAAQRVEP